MRKILIRISAAMIAITMGSGAALAQLPPDADSLDKAASQSEAPEAAAIYNEICWKLRNSMPEIAIQYASKAIERAEASGCWQQLLKGYSYMGVCQRNLGNYSEALEYYALGLKTAVDHQVLDQEAYAQINIANIYLYHNSFADCEDNLARALEIGKQLADSSILGYCYLNMGRVYMGLKNYARADSCLAASAEIRQKCQSLNYQAIVARKYLADSHAEQGNVSLAQAEYQECLSDKYIEGDFDLISDITHKMSAIYFNKGMLDSSLALAGKSLECSKMVGSKFSIMNAYDAIARVHFAKKDYKAAADNYVSQIKYNDSIFSEKLKKSVFNIQFSAEQAKKQAEIDKLSSQKKTANIILWGLAFILAMGVAAIILIARSNKKVKRLNARLQQQQKEISDSISYAKRIQAALLPDAGEFSSFFSDSFVFYAPRNVVSGDYYWQHSDSRFQIVVCADCTGHGVPGALVSMLGVSALHEIVGTDKERHAGQILNKLREMVKTLLKQSSAGSSQPKDGMDIAIMVIDKEKMELQYSGGNIPLIYIRDGSLEQIRPTRNPIGVFVREVPFQAHSLALKQGDRIYLSSDGYSSQFGGPKGDKIKMAGYKDLLMRIWQKPMAEQKEILEKEFRQWQGSLPQIDDILVMGFAV